MTYDLYDNVMNDVVEPLLTQGLDGLPQALTILLNTAMKIERQQYCGARDYERSDHRHTYSNGYKPKQLNTRVGQLDVQVPQVRDGGFYPSFLEKGIRSERALIISIAQMYFQGVSTRRVTRILEDLCDFDISSTEVSEAAAKLDDELSKWRQRELGYYRYVFLDALYEKVRYQGQVRDCAVLVAVGINETGHRDVLGCSVELSENERHWRQFLTDLSSRGLKGVELFISDAHQGLQAARQAIFPSVPWQRCHFHLAQNAQAYVPKKSQREEAARIVRSILQADSLQEAQSQLNKHAKAVHEWAPKLANWMEENLPEGFTYFDFPTKHHTKIRSSNPLERLNREIRRRTKKVGVFPNEESCERLISAVLMEYSEEWLAGRRYIKLDEQNN